MTDTERVIPRLVLHARDVSFDWSALPMHWIPGEPFATHLLDVLHLLLPEGETWFIRVFAAALPLVRDPQLAEDVRGFIGQEVTHAASHQGVLDHLAARGVDTGPYIRRLEWMFRDALGERDLTGDAVREWLVERIALIAVLEHVTASLGAWMLDTHAIDDAGADPAMLDLLRWHGAEEVVHRSVAHDLLVHLDPRWSRRTRVLIPALVILARLWIQGVAFLLRHDPEPTRPRWRDLRRASRLGLFMPAGPTLRGLLAYLRPGHHPSQHGSTDAALAYLATSPAARAADERASGT